MPRSDNNFVVRGRKTPIRDKPKESLSNSLRTSTSENLSHTKLSALRDEASQRVFQESAGYYHDGERESRVDAGRAADLQSFDMTPEKSELSLDLGSLNSSLNRSYDMRSNQKLNGGRTLNEEEEEQLLQEQVEDALQKLMDKEVGDTGQDLQGMNVAGKALSPSDSAWFTEPLHLTKDTEYPVFHSMGITEKTASSVRRPTGVTGTRLAQRTIATDCSISDEARRHFPVTLGEVPNVMRTITPSVPPTVPKNDWSDQGCPDTSSSKHSATHRRYSLDDSKRTPISREPSHTPHSRRNTRRSLACKFPGAENSQRTSSHLPSGRHSRAGSRSGTSDFKQGQGEEFTDSAYTSPRLQATYDYNFLKASQPYVDGAVVATPYQYELAQLKMERLRLEEQRLLARKREDELERTRGPQPKWYELKTPNFTYEHSKNNQLIRSQKDWQDLFDYRTKLLSSSHTFETATLR